MRGSTSSIGALNFRKTASYNSTKMFCVTSRIRSPRRARSASCRSASKAKSIPTTLAASSAARLSGFPRACSCARLPSRNPTRPSSNSPTAHLRAPAPTHPDRAMLELPDSPPASAGTHPLPLLHGLMTSLHREMKFDINPTHVVTMAAEAFALRHGVCQDITHIFIAASRQLGIPARYVGGHLYRADGMIAQEAGHAWAEAYVENLGWVGFGPANGISVTQAHVRVAGGLDYLGAAPVRGARLGGSGETLQVTVQVGQAREQAQS